MYFFIFSFDRVRISGSQFANANSLFANAKSSILRMAFCKNNVSKVDFHNLFECIYYNGVFADYYCNFVLKGCVK